MESLTSSRTIQTGKRKLVPVDLVDLQQAEPELAFIFERHAFSLKRIAGDYELWEKEPYAKWDSMSSILFPTCLGMFNSGRYKLFDGMHRAILLARRGEKAIRICYSEAVISLKFLAHSQISVLENAVKIGVS